MNYQESIVQILQAEVQNLLPKKRSFLGNLRKLKKEFSKTMTFDIKESGYEIVCTVKKKSGDKKVVCTNEIFILIALTVTLKSGVILSNKTHQEHNEVGPNFIRETRKFPSLMDTPNNDLAYLKLLYGGTPEYVALSEIASINIEHATFFVHHSIASMRSNFKLHSK